MDPVPPPRRRRQRTTESATPATAATLSTPGTETATSPAAPPPPRRTRRRVASPSSAVLRVASPSSAVLRVASPPPDALPSLEGAVVATAVTLANQATAATLANQATLANPTTTQTTLLDWFGAPATGDSQGDAPPPLLSESEEGSMANEEYDQDHTQNQDLIPCEICSEMVPFVRYTDHVEDCLVRQRTRLRQRALASLPQMAIRRLTATDPQHDGLHIQLFAPAAQTQVASLFHQLGFQILADALSHDGNDYEQNLALRDMLGDVVPPGLDNAAKEAATRPLDAAAVTGRDATCTICMDALPKADCQRYRETACRHIFCEPCLYRWLDDHHQCPNCLQSLRQAPDENLEAIE